MAVTITATFEPDQADPIVEIDPVDSILEGTSITLTGRVNPTGDPLTVCRFAWVPASDPDGFSSSAARKKAQRKRAARRAAGSAAVSRVAAREAALGRVAARVAQSAAAGVLSARDPCNRDFGVVCP